MSAIIYAVPEFIGECRLMGLGSRIIRKAHTAWTDLRYGSILKGNITSSYSHLGARGTENSGYDVLPALFADHVRPEDVLVDIGCGKGRVLNWWLDHYRNHQIYGIELDPVIAEQCRHRLRKFKNVTVLTGDACTLMPENGSLFYLFNPFDGTVMRQFSQTMLGRPRAANGLLRRIIYYNCIHSDVFESDPRFSVRHLNTPFHHSAIIDCGDISQISD
jgi:SAM-dependent methyltransferase